MVRQLDNERVREDGPASNVAFRVPEDRLTIVFQHDLGRENCATIDIERPGGVDTHHAAADRDGIRVNPCAGDV